VKRTYEPIDDPEDVTKDKEGVWHIKVGAKVRVVLNLINKNRNFHVALVDKLPAGFEALNAALKGTVSEDDTKNTSDSIAWCEQVSGFYILHTNLKSKILETKE
jgi:uncharacterized protein YfaS (alpha-2-macroglobulin family)